MTLELAGVAVASLAAGFIIARRIYKRTAPGSEGLLVPRKLTQEQYEKDRNFYIDMYRSSIQQYDRLVPWSAGGALLLSITFLKDVANVANAPRAILGAGWIALLIAVATSIMGHLMSSRIYSSARAALDKVHSGDESDTTMREAAALHRSTQVSGTVTEWLNYLSGAALIIGLGLLGLFAYLSL